MPAKRIRSAISRKNLKSFNCASIYSPEALTLTAMPALTGLTLTTESAMAKIDWGIVNEVEAYRLSMRQQYRYRYHIGIIPYYTNDRQLVMNLLPEAKLTLQEHQEHPDYGKD